MSYLKNVRFEVSLVWEREAEYLGNVLILGLLVLGCIGIFKPRLVLVGIG